MRIDTLVLALAGPLTALAAPTRGAVRDHVLDARQTPKRPPPCQPISPPPTVNETHARFDKFAHAFLVTKNITEAFEYISEGYINHNPAAQNGAASAWNILSPIWGSQQITVIKTAFKNDTGWLNYHNSYGTVVDRYRWDAGCIVEHWDQGEKMPPDA